MNPIGSSPSNAPRKIVRSSASRADWGRPSASRRTMSSSPGPRRRTVVCNGSVTGRAYDGKEGRMPQVRELMTKDPRTVQPDASVVDAARLMRDEDTGVVPIAEGDGRLVGVVTDRDITIHVVAEGKDPTATQVADLVS